MPSLKHVAIIMDGNGRWAKQHDLPRTAGHREGVKRIREIIKTCAENNIKVLTLFAFSTENWQRPSKEVDFLMRLFLRSLKIELPKLKENNVQLCFIGDRSRLSLKLKEQMQLAEDLTSFNTGLKLIIAIGYSGRWDIVQATQKIASQVARDELEPEAITLDTFSQYLSLNKVPEPDLFIRTGGECRLSNFLLWDLAYTELYFTSSLWPEFDSNAFKEALKSYGLRQRRFGLLSEKG